MTVGELRKALEGVPDELQVLREDDSFFLTEVRKASIASLPMFGNDEYRLGLGKVIAGGSAFFLIG